MNDRNKALIVSSCLVMFVYAGCTVEEAPPTNDDDATTQASAGSVQPSTSSTGPASSVASSSSGSGSYVTYECNPVTNEGCSAGAACDVEVNNMAMTYKFVCYGPPNENEVCEECGSNDLGWCQGGMTCITVGDEGACSKFCCDDGDCGDYGTCDKSVFTNFGSGEVGICSWTGEEATSGAGGGGTGGAGGAGTGGAGGAGGGTGGAGGGTGGAGGAGGGTTSGQGGAGGGTTTTTTGGGPTGITDGPVCVDIPDPSPSNGACVPVGS